MRIEFGWLEQPKLLLGLQFLTHVHVVVTGFYSFSFKNKRHERILFNALNTSNVSYDIWFIDVPAVCEGIKLRISLNHNDNLESFSDSTKIFSYSLHKPFVVQNYSGKLNKTFTKRLFAFCAKMKHCRYFHSLIDTFFYNFEYTKYLKLIEAHKF